MSKEPPNRSLSASEMSEGVASTDYDLNIYAQQLSEQSNLSRSRDIRRKKVEKRTKKYLDEQY